MMNPYKVLRLSNWRRVRKEDVKQAFRKLAFKYHPDMHMQSSKAVREDAILQFHQVYEAYRVLIDDPRKHTSRGFFHNVNDSAYTYDDGFSGGSGRYCYGQRFADADANSYTHNDNGNGGSSGSGYDYHYSPHSYGFAIVDHLFILFLLSGSILAIDCSVKFIKEKWQRRNSEKSLEKAKQESIEKENIYQDDKMVLCTQKTLEKTKESSIEKEKTDKDKRVVRIQRSMEAKESVEKSQAIKEKPWKEANEESIEKAQAVKEKSWKEAKESVEKAHAVKEKSWKEAKESIEKAHAVKEKSWKEAKESIEKAQAVKEKSWKEAKESIEKAQAVKEKSWKEAKESIEKAKQTDIRSSKGIDPISLLKKFFFVD